MSRRLTGGSPVRALFVANHNFLGARLVYDMN